MSFCSAGLLLLLFPLHNKTEHSWGWDMGWGVGGGGRAAVWRQAGQLGRGSFSRRVEALLVSAEVESMNGEKWRLSGIYHLCIVIMLI